jgi:gluconolactonase
MKVIATDLWFPEGPVVLPDGSFVVVEMRRQTLTHIRRDGRTSVIARLGGGPNGAALGPEGHIYVCNNGGHRWKKSGAYLVPDGLPDDYTSGRIERVNLGNGRHEVLYEGDVNRKLRGPNDLVFDALGGFWFTDFGRTRERDTDRGSVYYAKADGSMIREVIFPLIEPNGIALSPDGKTLYVCETITARVWAWEIIAPGELAFTRSHAPYRGRLVFSSSTFRHFDSMAVEANGNLCIGTLAPGGITVCDSAGGGELEFFEIPDPLATNICFGGEGLKEAYVCASLTGRLLQYEWPRAGLQLNCQTNAPGA